MGSPEEVARGYQLVAQKCAKWGLSVNAGKCEVIALARQGLDALRRAGLPMGVADDGRETQDAQRAHASGASPAATSSCWVRRSGARRTARSGCA